MQIKKGMIVLILWFMFAHYIGDYVFQSDFLAKTKATSFYSLFVHSFLYTMTIGCAFYLICGNFYMYQFFILLFSHICIDYVKANAKDKQKALTTYLYVDQILHITINYLLFILM